MKLINRHRECWGIMLHRWGNNTLELWFVPPRFTILPHSHPNEEIELYHVYGRSTFLRKSPSDKQNAAEMPLFSWLSHFTVPAGWNHWFSTTSSWLVFFNKATWINGVKPTSAAIDFQVIN